MSFGGGAGLSRCIIATRQQKQAMQRPGTPESCHGSGEEGKGRLGGGLRGAPAVDLTRKVTARGAALKPGTRMNGRECVNREGSTMATDFDELTTLVVADPLPLKTLLLPVLDTIGVKNILTAQDTREGFDLFRIHRPGLVLADWDMALLSGLDLTQMIRRAPLSPDYRTPVILLTGDQTAGVRMTQARDAGVTQLLLKPFSASELIEAITHAMNPREFIIDFLTYIGPDRRQDVMPGYAGLPRRATDRCV
jgi:CheY-like chemotaxis protein